MSRAVPTGTGAIQIRAAGWFGVAAVAGACRGAGIRVTQRRDGVEDIPASLRTAGVTVREYEVLRLLVERLGNREIADRLHARWRSTCPA
jgi:FixJ family two-component response regulator